MENFGIDDFLEMMAAEKGAAQNTLAAYRRDVEQFAVFAKVSGVSAFRQSHVSAFVQKLSEDKLAPKTIARKISALREYFKFLYSEREIKDNPAANVLSPKPEKAVAEISDRRRNQAVDCSGQSARRLPTPSYRGNDGTDVCLRFARI